ncbi:apolipoprotein N-acyltransferase [candidate division WOR-3 bacterium]|nr:apolipoprotein N-acyltransferase [candidate division WOR-3 bacterium]
MAFVALIPLLWVIQTDRRAFFHGWLFGVGLSVPMVWWLVTNSFPLRPFIRVLLFAGVIVLSGYLALFHGLFASLTRRIGIWSAPIVWVGVEMIRELTDLAFPWGFLGYTLTPWPMFTQTASIWGVYGLSALVVLVNLWIYKLVKEWQDRRFRLRWGILATATLVFMVGFGGIRLATSKKTESLKVALIQPNVPVVLKGSGDRDSLINAMLDQTREAARARPDLILYPETATFEDLTNKNRRARSYLELADSMDIPIVTGIIHWVKDKDGRTRFANSATVVHKDGKVDSIYIKIRLAPFGETIPFEHVLPFLRKIDVQGGHHYRGKEFVIFKKAPEPLSFLICYEAIFPNLTRRFVVKGSRLLCAVTNDVWFGPAKGPKQHAEMAVLRAVENGVPLIRAANNGVSMIVDPYGRVLKESKLLVKTVVVGEVPKAIGRTVYTSVGFLFPYLAAAATLVLLVVSIVRKKRDSKQSAERKKKE